VRPRPAAPAPGGDPREIEGRYQKGVEYYARGEYLQASAMFLRILRIDPDNGPARKALERDLKKVANAITVRRGYGPGLPEAERQPACVLACPTHARHFGDFDDPSSKVSTLTGERDGRPLFEKLGYKPVNRYLPPRATPEVALPATLAPRGTLQSRLAAMVNRLVRL
jgi:tetratricopeptide (TPR) repeat protein